MLLGVLAARVLGKHDFGIYAISSVFAILLQSLMYGGIYDYLIKDRSETLDVNTCFWMNLGFSGLGTLIIAALAPLMSYLMHSAIMMSLMLALAPTALLAAFTSWQEALLLRQARLKDYYILSIATETLACAVGLISLLYHLGIWSFVIYRYAQLTLATSGYYLMLRQAPCFKWDACTARTAFSFSGNIYASRIVGTLASYGADLVIGLLVSAGAAGAYRLGNRIVLGVSEIAYQPVTTMAWVHFSNAGKDDEALQHEWLSFITALSLCVWPALAFLALFSKSIVHLLVGRGWNETIPVIAILASARIIALFQAFLDPFLGLRDRTATILKLRSAASIISLLALATLARYGAVGAAAAQVLVSIFLSAAAIHVGLTSTRLGARSLLRALIPGTLSTAAAVTGASAARMALNLASHPIEEFLVAGGVGFLVWALTLLFLYKNQLVFFRVARS
jgi:O-antigen/teichoic acid export membrane protein